MTVFDGVCHVLDYKTKHITTLRFNTAHKSIRTTSTRNVLRKKGLSKNSQFLLTACFALLLTACGDSSSGVDATQPNNAQSLSIQDSNVNDDDSSIGNTGSQLSDATDDATGTSDLEITDTGSNPVNENTEIETQVTTGVVTVTETSIPDTINDNGNAELEADTGTQTNDSEAQTDSLIAGLPPIQLSPLPQPPITPAPSSEDEPIQVSGPVSTVSEYFLVRDGGGSIPKDTAGKWTLEDFNAGLQAPRITVPANVDTTSNPAPFFDGLENQTIFAGEALELILRPVDSDGTKPGMFPEFIPQNSQYIDNFNRTKTLRWVPLQPEVGIHEMKFTAVDAEEPQYRAEYTVLVQVLLPEDQSGIVNLSPGVNAMDRHTAQVNDPVVVEIQGTDPNGTVPTLEISNQPPGATLIPHHSTPGISVLRFVPTTTGLITLDVIARDAIDPSLTGQTTIEIDVRPAVDFLHEGETLRSLATARGFRLGYASKKDVYYRPDGALYARIAAKEFNFVTPENSLKWGFINPLPGRYRWSSADNLVSFAKVAGMEVHGHTLVWHEQLPNWIKFSAPEDRETHMREFIDRILTRYANDIPLWDVVNEVFEDDGSYRNSVWFEAMGVGFIETAFRQARASAPNARLLYNDYDVERNGPKSTAMFKMLQALKDRDTPLTGVGFQMHLFADFDRFDEVEANFQKAANMDLDVYVTELDVSMQAGHTEEQQAEVYRRVLDICLRQARCKGLQSWGFTDMYSWRRSNTPLMFDNAYQTKPAYRAMQERLSSN